MIKSGNLFTLGVSKNSVERKNLLHKRLRHPSAKVQKAMGMGTVSDCKVCAKVEFLRKKYDKEKEERASRALELV